MTIRIERVTKELLEKELNSDRFISGLETCLAHTLSTELATGMIIGKNFGNNELIYSEYLEVGDLVLCSGDSGEKYAISLYKKETGKKALDEEDTPTEDYVLYVANNSRLVLPHPMKTNEERISDYTLFFLNVTPGRIYPVRAEVEENHLRRYKRILRPITITANASYNDLVELFFFQENHPKLQIYDAERLKKVALELAIEAGTSKPEVEGYNVGRGYFSRKSRKVF